MYIYAASYFRRAIQHGLYNRMFIRTCSVLAATSGPFTPHQLLVKSSGVWTPKKLKQLYI